MMPFQIWRALLLPASYRGAAFKVENDAQSGGRRLVAHEFPKRDTPFVEDMGRRARRWTISAYIIGETYIFDRDALIMACEASGGGTLVHPSLGFVQASLETYSVSESRERGGICTFEMVFVETGSITTTSGTAISQDTASTASTSGANLSGQGATNLDSANPPGTIFT